MSQLSRQNVSTHSEAFFSFSFFKLTDKGFKSTSGDLSPFPSPPPPHHHSRHRCRQ